MTAMPAHVHDLYVNGPLPSRLRWVGLDTPLRFLAVLWIRSFRTPGLMALRPIAASRWDRVAGARGHVLEDSIDAK